MIFRKAVDEYFSLDIGATALRIAQLKKSGADQWNLEKIATAPLNNQKDNIRIKEAITQTIQQAGISCKNVAVSIPSDKIFTTVIEIPNVPRVEMDSLVHYQAENLIPTAVDNTKIDWALLGTSSVSPDKVDILVSSVENSYIEQQLDILEGAGLNVIAFEPASIAMARAILPKNITGNNLILNMNDSTTDLLVMVGENPCLVRSLPFGFNSLVNALSQTMIIEADEAKQYLVKYGVSQTAMNGDIYRNLHNILTQFVSEINKSMKFISSKYENFTIESVILVGYLAATQGFSDLINIAIQIPVKLGTPWQKVFVPTQLQQQATEQTTYIATTIGLSERGDA